MSGVPEICVNRASAEQISEHLSCCDGAFVPPLSERVSIDDFVHKIAGKAMRFEAWLDGELIGLVAAYCNDSETNVAFITSVSVLPGWQGRGIATQLITRCINHARALSFVCIELEVDSRNRAVVGLYEKLGFLIDRTNGHSAIMNLPV